MYNGGDKIEYGYTQLDEFGLGSAACCLKHTRVAVK